MSATINVYSLPQVVSLTLGGNTGAELMNYPVNNTAFKVTQGVTNEILFFVRDVDRQPVTLTNPPQMLITDEASQTLLANTAMTVYDANNCIYMLTLTPGMINDWPLGALSYSVLDNRADGSQVLLYTDRGYGPSSSVYVQPGPYPMPPEAVTITPSDMLTLDGYLVSSAYPGAAAVGNISGLQQASFNLNGYIGNIVVQASLDNQPTSEDSFWFDVQTISFANATTGANYTSFNGNYLWVRFKVQVFNVASGIYSMNNGAGYEAGPNSVAYVNSITFRND